MVQMSEQEGQLGHRTVNGKNFNDRPNLWTMMETFKKEQEDSHDKQKAFKASSMVQQFRKINSMQKSLDNRKRVQDQASERQNDKTQLEGDMIKFNLEQMLE